MSQEYAALDPRRLVSRVLTDRAGRPYTAAEVLAQLTPATPPASDPARARAILACAAQPSEWTDRLDARTEWQLGRLAARLPTIVYWYRAGLSLKEIGSRVSAFGRSYQARRALEAAARCIAARLNDRGAPDVRGAA
jgi:hypothetical protein